MSDDHGWVLAEELRPQIPEWVFRWLCVGSDVVFGWLRQPRRWMLVQPFRWLLFRKVTETADAD